MDGRQHELADVTADSELPQPERLQDILRASQELIGFTRASLYRPMPATDGSGPDAMQMIEEGMSWPSSQQEDAGATGAAQAEQLPRTLFERLFDERTPWQEGHLAYVPIVAANRTIGVLRAEFSTPSDCAEAMALMTGQSANLGARIPYRRFVDLVREVVEHIRQRGNFEWYRVANQIALHLAESICAVWTTDNAGDYRLLGRSGASLTLAHIPRSSEARGLIDTCLRSPNGVMLIDLHAASCPVEARDQLIAKGFHQGIAVAVAPDEEKGVPLLALMLWSRTQYRKDYYSADDQDLLRFVALILQTVLALHRLGQTAKLTYEELVKGISHELGAPLSTLYDAVCLAENEGFRRPHLMQDLKTLILYARELIGNLQLFSRVAQTPSAGLRESATAKNVAVFQ